MENSHEHLDKCKKISLERKKELKRASNMIKWIGKARMAKMLKDVTKDLKILRILKKM